MKEGSSSNKKALDEAIRSFFEVGIPFFDTLEESVIANLPLEYHGVANRFISARIELLRAVQELLEQRIRRLEETKRKLKDGKKSAIQKEKVVVK